MKVPFAFALSLAAVASLAAAAQAPQVEIRNAAIHVKIYVPDPTRGFYRASRFDWSGAIADLEFAGHHIYKAWFNSVNDATRDVGYEGDQIVVGPNTAMVGPVEEFQKAIGYDTAKPGETFLKIGVGFLRKVDDTAYQFAKHFDLVDGGTWKTMKTANSVTFQQVLGQPGTDYAYVYTKTIRLVGKDGTMQIEHHLKNTGKLPLVTPLYDHNFLTIDGRGVGPDYSITVPYAIKPTRAPDPKFSSIVGNKAEYLVDLKDKDRVAFGLQGFTDSPKDYDFRIENKGAQLAVRMVGDRPLSNASVWSIRSILAVEPFIDINAGPGQDFSWTYTYTYSELSSHH